jgi:hypothetical protein
MKLPIKKIIIGVLFISISLSGLIGWKQLSYSQTTEVPIAEANKCDAKDDCCITYQNDMKSVKTDWNRIFTDIRAQEKPASEITKDAFESIRSYECQLKYICSAVHYSGVNHPLSAIGTGLTSSHMETIPGCQAPEEMNMSGAWGGFVETLREAPLIGIVGNILPGDLYQSAKINFIPQCMTNPLFNNEMPSLILAETNYTECLNAVNDEMSLRILALRQGMNQTQTSQKARVLEKKLYKIINGMQGMQSSAVFMDTRLNSLASRYLCAPPKCT